MIKELKNVVIDVLLLKKLGCCKEGIRWFKDNITVKVTCDKLSLIQSDYNRYKEWLVDKLEAVTEYRNNGNEIAFIDDDDGYSYTYTYNEDGDVLTYNDSNGNSYTKVYSGDMVTTTYSSGRVITKQYKNLDKEFLEEIDRLFNTKKEEGEMDV